MIESMMYAAIGFLAASLFAVGIVPLLHARTERLTMQRLEASVPLSLSEVQAERDALRAEFAMTVRQLELRIESLTSKCARQMADLGRKTDLVNRLQIETDAQRFEIVALQGLRELTPDRPAPVPVKRRRLKRILKSAA